MFNKGLAELLINLSLLQSKNLINHSKLQNDTESPEYDQIIGKIPDSEFYEETSDISDFNPGYTIIEKSSASVYDYPQNFHTTTVSEQGIFDSILFFQEMILCLQSLKRAMMIYMTVEFKQKKILRLNMPEAFRE